MTTFDRTLRCWVQWPRAPAPPDHAPERSSAADPSPLFGGFELGPGDPFEGTVAPAVDTRAGAAPSAMSARRAEAGSTPTRRS